MARTKAARSTVTPVTQGDKVICKCGAQMRPWNYVEIPSRVRWIMWKCLADDDHITCMVPEYER